MTSPLLATVSRIVLPLAMLVALHLLLRGHHLPGGGFVAGLMVAVAWVLQFVATRRALAFPSLPCRPKTLLWLGLAIAATTAVLPMFSGLPLFTHTSFSLYVPGLGALKFSTPLLFDIGVALVVSGVTTAILIDIEE